ncbi:MAG: diacylglycerol/lipid kinase family protein [Solirubrobacterales bacterium]
MTLPIEKNYALIVNPSAGGGRALRMLPDVEKQFDERRMVFRVERTRSTGHGIDLAMDAIEANEVPVVMSGDGLIGAVGGAMAGVDAALGIIPAGRGNDLARGLGIPTDAAGAVSCIDHGFEKAIDVGEANGARFLGIASVGFDSEANRIANDAKVLKGTLVYAYAALRALVGWKPERFALIEGGVQTRYTGYTVAVGNNKYYGGGMKVAPDADLTDGKLDVVVIGDAPKLRFLMDLPKVFRGTHVKNEEVESWQATSLEIRASRPLTVYADGDPLTELPAKVRVLPSALYMIVPGETP